MDEWVSCTLSDLGTVVGGATPSTKKSENYENGKISWITPKDLSNYNSRYIKNGERNITELGLESCSTQLMPKGTVLFSSRAPIGYVAIAENELCTNQGFKSIIPNKNTDTLFLYYLLRYYKSKIENLGSGTTFKEVSASTMRNVEVRIPKEKKQQEIIGAILGALDDKIEENQKINDNLLEQCIALYHNYFDKYDASVSTIALADLADFKYGKMPDKKKLNTGTNVAFSGYQIVGNYPEKMFTEPQLLIVARGVGGCGDVKYSPCNSYLTNLAIAIMVRDQVYEHYIFFYLLLHDTKVMNTGSAQPQITIATLEKFQLPLPEMDDLVSFQDSILPIREMYRLNAEENNKLSALRDSLLPKLMSGELDISAIDI